MIYASKRLQNTYLYENYENLMLCLSFLVSLEAKRKNMR